MKIQSNMIKSRIISLKDIALNTNWFEKNIDKDKKNEYKNSKLKEKKEISIRIEKIKIIRKKLLKELYEKEYREYIEELDRKGLAIHEDKY